MSDPRVSIIMPVYNRVNFLRKTVPSALQQTLTDWEMIIADDGSSEETQAYLRSLDDPRITVLWLPHYANLSIVRNAAVRKARGRYLAFLDADDLWQPTKLARQVEALQAQPDRRWCYTAIDLIDGDDRPISRDGMTPWIPYDGDIVERLLTIEAIIAIPSVMVERSLLAEVGGFDESQVYHEDYELWIRLAVRSGVAVVDDPLTIVRDPTEHWSADRIAAYRGWVQLYGKCATSLPSAEWRAVARRRRAENVLTLARLYARAGRTGDAWMTLLRNAPRSVLASPPWIWRAARAAVRAGLSARAAQS
ncbi:MAG TPA: glycosyltransferase family A protein [Gemmatimonadaceae bacterium]|jgi:glycosyltransferase involved in cell wall biosynthesis|nr:glycosyltransferase family A protein [Gemmatimonadaceae bacterium]